MDSPKSPPVSCGFPVAESLPSPMALRTKSFPHSGFLPSASIPLNRKNYLLLPFREGWLPVGSMSERKRKSGIILSELFSRNSLFPSDRKPGRVPHSRRFLLWKRKECTSIPFPHTLQSWKRVPPSLKRQTFLSCKKFPSSLVNRQLLSEERSPPHHDEGRFLFLLKYIPPPSTTQHNKQQQLISVQKAKERKFFFLKFHPCSTKELHTLPTLRNVKSITSEI